MFTYFRTSVRAVLLVVALTFTIDALGARATASPPQSSAHTTARTRANAPAPNRDEFPLEGALIIVGIVGVVIVLAWVCSRIGDSR